MEIMVCRERERERGKRKKRKKKKKEKRSAAPDLESSHDTIKHKESKHKASSPCMGSGG
jgi:hypothetical protein